MTEQAETTSSQVTGGAPEKPAVEYAGFWIRFLAVILDTILLMMIAVPILLVTYGPGVLLTVSDESPGLVYDLVNIALPVVAFLVFWQFRSADPGKMMMDVYIVDAKTLGKPSFGQLVLRYIGYYVSAIPLCLGFIWAGIDKRKQGFHDKIAGTVVIKGKPGDISPAAGTSPALSRTAAEEGADEPPAPVNRYKSDPWKE